MRVVWHARRVPPDRTGSGVRGWVTALAVSMLAMSAGLPAGAEHALDAPVLPRDDWHVPIVVEDEPVAGPLGLFDDDPKGLVPKTPFVQRYSLDEDHWEVWLCGAVATGMADVIAGLEAAAVDYFDAISGGVYEPVFTAGGTIAASTCLPDFLDGINPTVGSPEGIVIIDDITGGGYASPGTICVSDDPDCPSVPSTFPTNRRYAVIGEGSLLAFPSVAVHEFSHALQWPHSNSGTGDEYDNPIDLMSGNSTSGGSTEPDPYGTLSYNRYQSGWVQPSEVVVATGSSQSLTLQPFDRAGTQLLAVRSAQEGRFHVFGARTTSVFDPIPSTWQGVEVYVVDHYCGAPGFGGGVCPGLFRSHTQEPPSPRGVGHVLQPGEWVEVEGLTITIGGSAATG